MFKSKYRVWAFFVAAMVLAASRNSAAISFGHQDAANLSREPIRVGGNVQESKLLYRVEPVYPEEAVAARLSGVVILQVTVDKEGKVSEIKVLRSHPLLEKAAVDAVQQWRYSQTFLNGEPVPVIATVTVAFNTVGGNETLAILDERANLRAPALQLEGEALSQRLKQTKHGLRISANPALPLQVIEEAIRMLQAQGIQDIQVSGCRYREGRLYQISTIGSLGAPEITLDRERLTTIARESIASITPPASGRPFSYILFINELGEIVGLEPQSGIKLPAVESELLRARITSPGIRNGEPVPTALIVELLGSSMIR